MRRPPTLLLPLLLLIFLLQDSSAVSSFKVTQGGDASFVVFSSFPSFSTDGDEGDQTSTIHAAVDSAAHHVHDEGEAGHDGSSASQHGAPLSISEVEGLGESRDTPTDQGDVPDSGIFLFSALMKDQQDKTLSFATESSTPVAADASTTISDTIVIPNEPTAVPIIILPEVVPASHPSSTISHVKPSDARESGSHRDITHDLRNHSQPEKAAKDEHEAVEAPISGGSLASRLKRLQPNLRHSTRTQEQEKERDFSQQMTLAERLKALQARRAEGHDSQARQDHGHLGRDNLTPNNKERPIQRRLGEFTDSVVEGETKQKSFSITIEPNDTLIDLPEDGGETIQTPKEIHDLDVAEASIIHTTLSEQATSSISQATSAPSSSLIKPTAQKPQRLTYSQRLRARLQKQRQRRLRSTTPRPHNPRPNNSARPQTAPRPKPQSNTRRGLLSRTNTTGLSLSQRRRQQLYKRLRNRNSTTRPPTTSITGGPQREDSATTPKTPFKRVPPRRPSFLPTTKRPISLREKIEQFRKRNRFVPFNKRKQTTETTTTSTTVAMTSTTTTQPPTTIRTTLGLALNTWPVTQEPDYDNSLVTVPSTTEVNEVSRQIQIRQMIDAMLGAKDVSGTTTTEQVHFTLEEAASNTTFMHTTESPPHSSTEQSSSSRFTVSVGKNDRSEFPLEDPLTTITESINFPTTARPSTSRAGDPPNLFQHFPSLAEKLAVSQISKKSKYHPSSALSTTFSTPPKLTLEDESSAADQHVTTPPELLADDNDLHVASDSSRTEETDTDTTTATPGMDITTPISAGLPAADVDDISPTTQASQGRTTTEDNRVQNLIAKLLAQGVITMPVPDDSHAVSPSMDNVQPTTIDPDTLPPEVKESQAPSRASTDISEMDSNMSIASETDKSKPSTTFKLPHHLEEPQLTRGAPPTRIPVFSDSPFVFPVTIMDTTDMFSMDDVYITEAPPTTTLADDLFQTSPPNTQAEDSKFPVAEDVAKNEINAVNSKDNLHSLIRSFDRPLVRPELAAVNQVLGFSLTTDDMLDHVEVNLEKPQASEDEDTFYDDIETAATEQVMITTSLIQDEDLTSTPLNLDMTFITVSESSPQIQSATEATSLSIEDTTSYTATATGTQLGDDKNVAMSTKESNRANDPELNTAEPITIESPQTTSESPAMQAAPTSEASGHQTIEEDPKDNVSAPGSVSAVHHDALMPTVRSSQQSGSDNETTSLQKLLRQGASDKADDSPSDSMDVFQGVSKAVLRERLHLLRLVKERQGDKSGNEAPERLRTTSESPTTTSRLSLREFANKRTTGENTKQEMTPKPSRSNFQPKQESTPTTEVPDTRPVISTTTVKQTHTQEETSNNGQTSDAMRRFLQLNKHAIEALRAKDRTASNTEAPTPPAILTPPTTASTNLFSIPLLAFKSSGLDNQESPPVISEVTPQSHITISDIPEGSEQPSEGTKRRTSSFLRPTLPVFQRNDNVTQTKPSSHGSSTNNHFPTPTPDGSKSNPVTPTPRSRILPSFRFRRPHPPTRFSITQQEQQVASPLLPAPSESAVESPKVLDTTLRPPIKSFSTISFADVPTTDMVIPNEPNVDKDIAVARTFEVPTERPIDDSFTTLASLLKRKHILNTKFHHAKHETTSLPITTKEDTSEATTQPDNDTLAPVTFPEQEETMTTQQLFDERRPNPVLQSDHISVKVTDKTLTSPSVKGTFSMTEEMNAENVPPPFNFLDPNRNVRTRLQGTSEGAFRPGSAFFDTSVGVVLPLFTTGAPKAVFPTAAPAIQFEPTPIPTRFPSMEAVDGLDTSATTVSPSSFPTNPVDFEAETVTLPLPRVSLDMDTNIPPVGFKFILKRKSVTPSLGLSPSSISPLGADDGILTTGGDTLHGGVLQAPFFTITPEPEIAPFTLGHNEAFVSDNEAKSTTFLLPVTKIPVVTTPITTITPQLILLTLPVVNGSVTTGSLLPDHTFTSDFEEDNLTSTPSTTSTPFTTISSPDHKNVQSSESLAHPPDLMHMITKGVTITSTEGVIGRVLPPHVLVPQPLPHSAFLPLPTDSSLLQEDQKTPKKILQKDGDMKTRILSASLPLLKDTEKKILHVEETIWQQQQRHHPDETGRPNLQGGHLNLNKLQQRHLGGQETMDGSHDPQTPSGLQIQQTEGQVVLGQQSFQEGKTATGEHASDPQNSPRERKGTSGQHHADHTVHEGRVDLGQVTVRTQETLGHGSGHHIIQVMQQHSEGQPVPGQHNEENQDLLEQRQLLRGQLTIQQRKETVDQHNTATQHKLKQGQGVEGQHGAVNQQSFVQDDVPPGQHNIDQHTFVHGQDIPLKQVIEVQNIHQDEKESTGKHSVNQQLSGQGQENPGQHTEQPEHHHHSQQNVQGQIIQGQHNPQGQIIQSQHNAQDQHNLQGQHIAQDEIIQGQHNRKGQIAQGHLNSHQKHNLQEHIIQGQHNSQNQHNPREQSTRDPHEPTDQTSNTRVIQELRPQPQNEPPQHGSTQDGHTAPGGRGHFQTQTNQDQGEVSHGQSKPEQHTFTGQQILHEGQKLTISQEHHQHQHDAKQHATEEAKHQVQQSSQLQHNSRRGKFISGDEVLKAQHVIKENQRSQGHTTLHDVHGSRGRIIGESVVTAEENPQTPPSVPQTQRGSVGRFTNSAAGFLRGPADSFITGFASLGERNPVGGGEEDSPSTIPPPKAKAVRRRNPASQDSDGDEIPGQAGIDYPIQTKIPQTNFTCTSAMANMMFADPTSCQVYHVCGTHQVFTFLCPKGTLFNQDTSVCQWWFSVDCARQARRLAEVRALVAG